MRLSGDLTLLLVACSTYFVASHRPTNRRSFSSNDNAPKVHRDERRELRRMKRNDAPLTNGTSIDGARLRRQADPCASAPTSAQRELCRQLSAWHREAVEESLRPPPPPTSTERPLGPPGPGGGGGKPGPQPRQPSVDNCMSWDCVCRTVAGRPSPDGSRCERSVRPSRFRRQQRMPLLKTKRKEYRLMLDEERRRFHAALNQLKQTGVYDVMVKQHATVSSAPGAHGGPAFLPWHREFLKRLEIQLRLVDWTVSLPFWDSRLDQRLHDPRDSMLWTDDFMGATDDNFRVVTGAFKDWRPTDGEPTIIRRRGFSSGTKLFSETLLGPALQRNTYHELASKTCPIYADYDGIEATHGQVHLWVNGHMFRPQTSPNDPVFFLHHGFVDYLWEQWREQKQTRQQRQGDYFHGHYCTPGHDADTPMKPFDYPDRTNINGLSNDYTDNMYGYERSPECTARSPDCGSKYLFCDTRAHQPTQCVAKVRMGGDCTGFDGLPACYGGQCVANRCVTATKKITTTTSTSTTTMTMPTDSPKPSCVNENKCCDFWNSRGECRKNPSFMHLRCKVSCNICEASYSLKNNTECIDYLTSCQKWKSEGECSANEKWMAQNCRKACGLCHTPREYGCTIGGTTVSPVTDRHDAPTPRATVTTPADPPKPSCFNEDKCCEFWNARGECRKNPSFMHSWCKVSCNICEASYSSKNYTECVDYHRSCQKWKSEGECGENEKWMAQNCREACGLCHTPREYGCTIGGTTVPQYQTAVTKRYSPRTTTGRRYASSTPTRQQYQPTTTTGRRYGPEKTTTPPYRDDTMIREYLPETTTRRLYGPGTTTKRRYGPQP